MSKINALRFINLNYNHHTITADDELYELGGESSLLSLRNGGGKSVLVQMVIALFVHKKYRNKNDRAFSSYFTDNRPSFILAEWQLDAAAGYALTGMMVRKNPNLKDDERPEELEIVNFIHEYRQASDYDIRHLPVLEQDTRGRRLKSFNDCRQLFEELKRDHRHNFYCYDMNHAHQARQYFDRLREYRIYYKEWESIIHTSNLKESGLSDLFKDAKNEKGLIEKWFLKAVEDKLQRETDRIGQFADIIQKYIHQYQTNRSKILRKAGILAFKAATQTVIDRAEELQDAHRERESLQNRIVNLLVKLRELRASSREEQEAIQQRLEELELLLAELRYEELSLQAYAWQDEAQALSQQIEQAERQARALEQERLKTERKIHIMQCARLYAAYQDCSREQQRCESELELCRQKNQDLSPEREQLGYTLRRHYEQIQAEQTAQLKAVEGRITEQRRAAAALNEQLQAQRTELLRLTARQAAVEADLRHYDQYEADFNLRHQETLRRNLPGFYEEGALALMQRCLNDELAERGQALNRLKKRREENDAARLRLNREMEDQQRLSGAVEQQIQALEQEREELEQERAERLPLLRYIDRDQAEALNTAALLEAFDRLLEHKRTERQSLDGEREQRQAIYARLQNGRLLELPAELIELLQAADIPWIYGMEWLRHNGRSPAQNRKLTARNPFIPYSIIISEQDLSRLAGLEAQVFTDFPIPIVRRESLEQSKLSATGSLIRLEAVDYYVAFNQQLLDKAGLAELLRVQQQLLDRLDEQLAGRQQEIDIYRAKRDIISRQRLSAATWETCDRARQDARQRQAKLEQALSSLREQRARLSELKNQLDQDITQAESARDKLSDKLAALERLQGQYAQYLKQKDEQAELAAALAGQEQAVAHSETARRQTEQEIDELGDERRNRMTRLEKTQEKVRRYQSYAAGAIINRDIEDLEARFEAISTEVQAEEKVLTEQLHRAQEAFTQAEDELLYEARQCGLNEADYCAERYDRFQVEELKHQRQHLKQQRDIQRDQEAEHKIRRAVLAQQIADLRQKINAELGRDALKPRADIVQRDYAAIRAQSRADSASLEERGRRVAKRLQIYNDNLAPLAEFADCPLSQPLTFAEDFRAMNQEALYKFRGKLQRDYHAQGEIINQRHNALSDALNRIREQSDFQDDYFRTPLNTLAELKAWPDRLLPQLAIYWESYDLQMAKLEEDINVVEKEKAAVIALLLDYVRLVNDNLNLIDKNSTITIRDRSVKMLRLKLPDWDEHESLYRLRMTDYLESLTALGLDLLDKNQSIEEKIGSRVSTRSLCDDIIGIGNIEVKLYKIEEQKEYPISWSEVARNSGGEGFLSAFVILSSLLNFMRRDETDLFSERREGKVLLMDNPFAQTNAAHLLKPMMDIAAQSNTQLICLTGLGGESIYNCFNNIYVLNLVNSHLKSGRQYLQSERVKGQELTQSIVSSQVKVEDLAEDEVLF